MGSTLEAIIRLGKVDPQMAMKMLAGTASHSMSYYTRVTPPQLIMRQLLDLDVSVASARLQCLTPDG